MIPVHKEYKKLSALALKLSKSPGSTVRLSDTVEELAVIEAFASDPPGDGPFTVGPQHLGPINIHHHVVPSEAATVPTTCVVSTVRLIPDHTSTPDAGPPTPPRFMLKPKILMPDPHTTRDGSGTVTPGAAAEATVHAGPAAIAGPTTAHLVEGTNATAQLPTNVEPSDTTDAATGTTTVATLPVMEQATETPVTNACCTAARLPGVQHCQDLCGVSKQCVGAGTGTDMAPAAGGLAPSSDGQRVADPDTKLSADDVVNPFLDPPGSAANSVEYVDASEPAGGCSAVQPQAKPSSHQRAKAQAAGIAEENAAGEAPEGASNAVSIDEAIKRLSNQGQVQQGDMAKSTGGLCRARMCAVQEKLDDTPFKGEHVDEGTPDCCAQGLGLEPAHVDNVAAVMNASTTAKSARDKASASDRNLVSMEDEEKVHQGAEVVVFQLQTRPGWRSQRKRRKIA